MPTIAEFSANVIVASVVAFLIGWVIGYVSRRGR